ncbi:MAG: hypothetical protein K0R82_2671 [Flavipsychrobacter sp.]|jgi:hypothetical protein|nr:hypothetical protein [Flavipsychrobacter sp.]
MKTLFTLLSFLAITTVANAQNLQGTLETWQNYMVGFPIPTTQLEKPAGWHGSDSLVFQLGPLVSPGTTFEKQLFRTTTAHGGAYAALLANRYQGSTLGVLPALMTNAIINIDMSTMDFTVSGGTPVTMRIDTVKAWVRYLPRGTDMGVMTAQAVRTGAGAGGADSVVGEGFVDITANNNYYEIVAALSYPNNLTPNALQVSFAGSSDFAAATDSTELFVDDVSAVGTVGVKMQLFTKPVIEVYPNPATAQVYITNTTKEAVTWELYSMNGAKVLDGITVKGKTEADVSAVATGSYIYQVKNKGGDIVQTGKLDVVR